MSSLAGLEHFPDLQLSSRARPWICCSLLRSQPSLIPENQSPIRDTKPSRLAPPWWGAGRTKRGHGLRGSCRTLKLCVAVCRVSALQRSAPWHRARPLAAGTGPAPPHWPATSQPAVSGTFLARPLNLSWGLPPPAKEPPL